MIKINYGGRLGNNLFQFFCANIISNKFNLPISNPLKNSIIPYKDKENKFFEKDVIVTESNFFEIMGKDDIDCNLHLQDWFQNENIVDLFIENRDKLNLFKNYDEKNEDVFIHVRLGDLFQTHNGNGSRFLSYEYYDSILENLKFKKGYISSDSPENDMVKSLITKYNLELFNDSPENTIIFASQCNNKVLSLGTFSWWIGFLGSQKNVICPNQEKNIKWHGKIFTIKNWKTHSI
jgi:hypothetical protein